MNYLPRVAAGIVIEQGLDCLLARRSFEQNLVIVGVYLLESIRSY